MRFFGDSFVNYADVKFNLKMKFLIWSYSVCRAASKRRELQPHSFTKGISVAGGMILEPVSYCYIELHLLQLLSGFGLTVLQHTVY